MIRINEQFPGYKEAKEYQELMLRRYHPAGYGTTLECKQQADGTWTVTGTRFNSCD